MSKNIRQESLAGIQYLGKPGISDYSKNAIIKLIHFGDKINKAKLLSCSGVHCFLLYLGEEAYDLIAIKSGFNSGYRGGGPDALATALQLLERHGADIEEYNVPSEVIERLNQSCLTRKDIETIEAMRPIRPQQWPDYIYDMIGEAAFFSNHERLRYDFPKVIPFWYY